MADPTFPLAPLLAFVSLLMTTTPLGFISPREHIGVVAFIFWQSMNCIQLIVTRVLWHGTTEDLAPLFCDIASKVELAISIGIPASELCIMRGIYNAIRVHSQFDTRADPTRLQTMLQNLSIAVLFPIVIACSWPLIAARRYVIMEDVGCTLWIRTHWVSLVVFHIWPPSLSIATAVYCALTIQHCSKVTITRQGVFAGHSGLKRHLFVRTLICVTVVMISLLAVCMYYFVAFLRSGVAPFPGLAEIAQRRKTVAVVDISGSRGWDRNYNIRLVRRLLPSFVFFAIFGTGDMAISFYGRVYSRVVTRLGFILHAATRTLARNDEPEAVIVIATRPVQVVDRKPTNISPINLGEEIYAENPGETALALEITPTSGGISSSSKSQVSVAVNI